MVEPLTGVFQQLAEAEVAGARLAIEEINHSGGILGREAQLLVADFGNVISTGVEQTRQLIDKDQVDFITGNVNSAIALAMTRVTAEKRKLQIVTGGHTDEITGSQCSWNVFRVCKSTTMEANAIADALIEKFGARWYFLTPDYVYGHALQTAFELKLQQHGGGWAAAILPVGTEDYSDALTNAAAFRPNVLIDLMGGDDQVNSLRQIASFGLTDQMAVGGALFELESILSVPDAARVGWWTMEWWWNQPDVPGIKTFDAAIRSRTGKAASARSWFGYAGIRTIAEIANQEKSLDAVVLARALQGYTLPGGYRARPQSRIFQRGRPRAHEHDSGRRSASAGRLTRSMCSLRACGLKARRLRVLTRRKRAGSHSPANQRGLTTSARAAPARPSPCDPRSNQPAD